MKIRAVGADLFHADGQRDKHDEANSRLSQQTSSARCFCRLWALLCQSCVHSIQDMQQRTPRARLSSACATGLQMVQDTSEYTEQALLDRRQGVVLQLWGLGEGLTIPYRKNITRNDILYRAVDSERS